MAFVLDCSVAMAWMFTDEAGPVTDELRDSLARETAVLPSLWPIEVGNVLRTARRRGRISRDDWGEIGATLGALPIEIDPVSFSRVLESVLPIADHADLSVYDAMYLELAARRNLPLATIDHKLSAAAASAGIEVIRR